MESPETIIEEILDFFSSSPQIIILALVLFSLFRRRAIRGRMMKTLMPAKPASTHTSTSIECTNCGLVNPSVWEKCERCGALLGTNPIKPIPTDTTPNDAAPPLLVKKI